MEIISDQHQRTINLENESDRALAGTFDYEVEQQTSLNSLHQFINRYDAIPGNLEVTEIFQRISGELTGAAESEKRQLAARLLYEIIPKVDEDLDKSVRLTNILPALVLNLGHSVSAVRKAALNALIVYIKCSSEPESVIRVVVTQGIESSGSGAVPHYVRSLPVIVKTVKDYSLYGAVSHSVMMHLITCLSKKMVQITYQEIVVRCLFEIKRVLGESKFDHFLETYYPQVKRDFDMFCEVYNMSSEPSNEDESKYDSSDDSEKRIASDEDNIKDESPPDMSEQVTLVAKLQIEDEVGVNEAARDSTTADDDTENDSNSDDDVIMKVYDENGNEIRRTSSRRRVTFGGEVVKIRTPDSETTVTRSNTTNKEKLDITANIVIQISNESTAAISVDDSAVMATQRKPRSSLIPVPIKPALNRPKDRRVHSFRQPSTTSLDSITNKQSRYKEYRELSEIPNYEGESLTSSSDSSDQCKGSSDASGSPTSFIDYAGKEQVLINNTLIDLTKLGITDATILNNLFRQDDWHLYMRGLDRLTVTLRQPEVIQNLSFGKDTSVGISLLCYLMNSLLETRTSQRVTASILRAQRSLCSALRINILMPYLISLVPAVCKYLSPSYGSTVRSDAAEIMKTLMQNLTPTPIINVIFTEQCFFSRSSKMRENSLLCLMYALMTFPSTEFNRGNLTEILIKHSAKEPKRRVRQAILDTLSILAQFLPRSLFKVDGLDPDSIAFKHALRDRLNRRQLPTVSPDGLILYAFQVSPATTFGNDIEWILNGRGSLSLNCSKMQGQFHYNIAEDNNVLPTRYSNWLLQSNNKMAVSGSASILHYPSSRYTPITNDGKNYGYIEKDNVLHINNNYVDGFNREYIDSKFPYPSTYAFPKLSAQYESGNRRSNINENPDFAHYTQSKLPIRHTSSTKSPIRYLNQDLNTGFPTLATVSPKKKITDQINNYIREKQQKNSSFAITDEEESFQSYQSSDRLRSDQIDEEVKSSADLNVNLTVQNHTPIKYVTSNESTDRNHDFENISRADETDNTLALVPFEPNKLIEEQFDSEKIDKHNQDEKQDECKTNGTENNDHQQRKVKKYLERKPVVRLKRSNTKEIKMPQSSFCLNPETLPPFEYPKDGLHKTLLQLESNEWETVIQGLQGVVRLSKHHSKQLAPSLHMYVCAIAKHVRNLRSQVARAACLSAESIFKYMNRISDQDVEEMANALFSRTADTNKFIREDSNKALDVMIDNIHMSKCIINILQKMSSHPNATVRSSVSRLVLRLIRLHGPNEIMTLTKENRDTLLKTAVKFLTDANLETRKHAKDIFAVLIKNERILTILSETVPTHLMNSINKSFSRIARLRR